MSDGPTPVALPARRSLSIRSTFILMGLAAAACAAALALFLGFTLLPRAMEVRSTAEPAARLIEALDQRVQAVHAAMPSLHALTVRGPGPGRGRAGGGGPMDSAAVALTRARIVRLSGLPPVQAPDRVIDLIRPAVVHADRELERLERAGRELIAFVDAGRMDSAGARFARADSLRRAIDDDLTFIRRRGLEYLVSSQIELAAATRRATWAFALILFLALAYPVLFLRTLLVRLGRPLSVVDGALDRVGTGDLTAELPVARQDEMGRLAVRFNAMTRLLRSRVEGQGRFAATGELLAGIAHEVNNPLQAITALVELRIDEPSLRPSQRRDLQVILRQARRAGKLLASLLHFVRPGEPHVTDLDLSDIVARVVDLLSYQFGVDEVLVENRVGAGLPLVRADAARLEQLFVNLLANAIDAVRVIPTPRKIMLEAWEHDRRLEVAVTDNGRGVDRDVASRVFQPFVTTKGARGTGLGLYVSRQLARQAGGDLELRSAPGQGACFVASFPIRARVHDATTGGHVGSPSGEGLPAAAAAGEAAGLTILLVDDEEAIRRPLSRYLAKLGATVIHAADGLDALTQVGAFAVDAIILDLRMPRMDGVEFYATIRSERPALASRIVFLSGDPEQLTAARTGALPADRVLAKPVDLNILTDRIRQVVGRRAR
jgi:signal transduction histidine kinase/CheY-like chemotaxis protein